MLFIYLTIFGAVSFLLIHFFLSPSTLKTICPNCEDDRCIEIGREQVGLDYQQRNHGIGAKIMVESKYEVRFHCKACETTFKKTISETR